MSTPIKALAFPGDICFLNPGPVVGVRVVGSDEFRESEEVQVLSNAGTWETIHTEHPRDIGPAGQLDAYHRALHHGADLVAGITNEPFAWPTGQPT